MGSLWLKSVFIQNKVQVGQSVILGIFQREMCHRQIKLEPTHVMAMLLHKGLSQFTEIQRMLQFAPSFESILRMHCYYPSWPPISEEAFHAAMHHGILESWLR